MSENARELANKLAASCRVYDGRIVAGYETLGFIEQVAREAKQEMRAMTLEIYEKGFRENWVVEDILDAIRATPIDASGQAVAPFDKTKRDWLPEQLEIKRPLIIEVTETTIHHEREPHCCGCFNGYKVLSSTTPIQFIWQFVCNECGEYQAAGSSRHFNP